jgi:hypothetical protein
MALPTQVSSRRAALAAGAIAGAALIAAGWLGWMIGWPATFDTRDPDFVNPFSIMILGLIGAAVWFGIKAIAHERRHRAFGVVTLDLDPPGHLRLGQALGGRLRTQRPVRATGPFRLVLTCHDVQSFEDDGRFKTVDFPVWIAECLVPQDADAVAGLRFRFELPASVGTAPVPSGILPGSGSRHRMTVHIPGRKRIVAGNTPPVNRYWTLNATALTAGQAFRANVLVPTDRPQVHSRLP